MQIKIMTLVVKKQSKTPSPELRIQQFQVEVAQQPMLAALCRLCMLNQSKHK